MIIYGALLIPFITGFVLYRFYRKEIVWWEIIIPLAVSALFTIVMKASIEAVQVRSKEYWGSIISRVEYYEDWNEYIHRICTRTCCCDSKGNNCSIETYDCSYVQYHGPRWEIITTTGETISIDEREYNLITKKLGNEHLKKMHRNYYTNDGDMYFSEWNKDSVSAIPVTTLHYYENRIKAADQSVFHFKQVSNDDILKYHLKSYPDITNYYKMNAVLGDSSEDAAIANKKMQYINGVLGPKKEVRIFILVFENQPIEAGFYQEWHWSGANMNEFVVCIGIDAARKVTWCLPFSWTTNEQLKVDIKSFVQNQPTLDLSSVADYLHKKIDDGFVRRDFKEFDYLTVEPPTWAVILTYLLTMVINFALSCWIVKNEFCEDE
jgi:hypothetical protein